MQSMAPLPFDELEDLLADLTSAHHERQHWILQHWPHVVEASQVSSAAGRSAVTDDHAPDLEGVLF
jgi:hypothetical protein